MRSELKKPLGLLLEGEARETVARLEKMLSLRRPVLFASVGDVSSMSLTEAGIQPDIIVVDNRVMRRDVEPMSLGDRITVRTRNNPGTIGSDSWRALEEAVRLKRGVAVIVEGEEDLLVLPLIILMPMGSLIAYGQPRAGMVVIEVTEERKRWADGFMERMEDR